MNYNARTKRTLPPILVAMLFCLGTLSGQPYRDWVDPDLPEEPVPDLYASFNTFPLSVYILSFHPDYPLENIWRYVDTMRFDNVIRWVYRDAGWEERETVYDTLLRTAPPGRKVIPTIGYAPYSGSYLVEAGHAREVVFFPFDSSQLRRAPSVSTERREFLLMNYAYDSLGVNRTISIDGTRPLEAIYRPASAGTVVASGISFRHTDERTWRWDQIEEGGEWRSPRADDYDSVVDASRLFYRVPYYWYRYDTVKKRQSEYGNRNVAHRSPHYVVLKGRLTGFGSARWGAPLLRVRVYYEVDRGKTYVDSSGREQRAEKNLRFLYEEFDVTKSELFTFSFPLSGHRPYREIARKISFESNGGMGGPLDTVSLPTGAFPVTANRIDLEVEYLGGEELVLHSVAIRDSIAHLLLGGPGSEEYYGAMEEEAIDLMRADSNGQIHDALFTIDLNDEPPTEEFLGFRMVNEWMKRTFRNGEGDSVAVGHGDAHPHLEHLGGSDWVQTLSYYGGPDPERQNRWAPHMHLPTDKVPTVQEHNGGRFTIPLLFPLSALDDPDYMEEARERIALMNETFQLSSVGAANPEERAFHFRVTRAQHLHRGATESRQSGRRYRVVLGPVGVMKLTYDPEADRRDTFAYHFPEASELRLLASLGLAYGAKAFRYYSAEPNAFVGVAEDGGPVGWFEQMFVDWGLVTPERDVMDWTLYRPGWPRHDSIGVIPNLYTGFKAIHDEMVPLNRWLQQIGGRMLSLRWRDAYSLHWQARRPGNAADEKREPRRLPSDEIVTRVETRNRLTGALDSAWRTYVELGLFDTVIDTTDGLRNRLRDTNYLVVVNRRVFERGNYRQEELGFSNLVARRLDTLSETREITLQLNLGVPGAGEEYRLQVREVEPDITPLPLLGPRRGLDTVVAGNGEVRLILGAGRAALLEVTYRR